MRAAPATAIAASPGSRPAGSLVAGLVAATLLWPLSGAFAAGATELSTGPANGAPASPGVPADAHDLGLNEAIRAGDARRGTELSTSTGDATPLAPRPEYASLPVYVGTLGDQPVRLRIGPKPDERDSVRGEYTVRGKPGVRLLAGEYENGGFLMEESADGTRVSGNWEGNIDRAGVVSGTWTDPDHPAIVLPFRIRPLGVLVIPPFDMTPNSGITYAPPPPKSSITGR